MDEKVADRILGTILGAACGNSLGGSTIGLNHKEIVASVGVGGIRSFSPGLKLSILPSHQPGAPLADTHLALALAKSVIAYDGQFNSEDLKHRFSMLLEDEAFLSSAPGTQCLAGLRRMADKLEPINDGSQEATHDHGAARAYPLGCLPDRVDIVTLAVKQAQLSQADSRVWAAAAVVAHSVSLLVRGCRLDTQDQVRSYVHSEFDVAKRIDSRFAESWDDVAPDLDYVRPAHELPYSLLNVQSHVNEAIPTAVGIFLIFRHNLEEAICAAAAAGGDTDTVGAIVGALSGAYHGASAIPSNWLDNIKLKDELTETANGLIALW